MAGGHAIFALLAASVLSTQLATCRSPGEGGKGAETGSEKPTIVELPAVDTEDLTAREKREWSQAVGELLAPCPDQPVSVAECVKESRPCKPCAPAARFLVTQVQKGRTRAQVETAYKKRFAADQVKDVPTDGSPAKGPDSAPVTIVEWADFECPACAGAAPLIEELLKRYPGQIRLVFKNYPLSIHKHAEKAARAAVAAGRQGKFWEMHAALFALHPKPLDKETLEEAAKKVGLDVKRFWQDVESEAVADVVARDRKQADALDLEGTPFIYINGRHFDFDHFELGDDLDEWIKLEIELKTGKRPVAKVIEEKPDAAADDAGDKNKDKAKSAPKDKPKPALSAAPPKPAASGKSAAAKKD